MSIGMIASAHVPFTSGGDYSAEVLADSPEAFWVLDEGTGTNVADSSGNARTAILAGGYTWSGAGLFSGATDAVDFTGTNGSSNFAPEGGSWQQGDPLTVEAVIKPDNVSSVRHIGLVTNRWEFYISSTGKLSVDIYGTGGWNSTIAGSTSLSADTVYHVAFTVSGTAVKMYLNGSEDGAGTLTTAPLTSSVYDNRSFWGYGTRPSTSRYDGEQSHQAIYGTALSSTRIAAHYAAA